MPNRFRRLNKQYVTTTKRQSRTLKRIGKHPAFLIPMITFGVLLALTVSIFLFFSDGTPKLQQRDSRLVIISHDKEQETIPTKADTVEELLQKMEITLRDGDIVEPSIDTRIDEDNFRVNVYRAAPVTIVDGDKKIFTYSAAATPRSIAKQVGVEVYPEDRLVSMPTENFLSEGSIGERVVVERATPVAINLYGTPLTVRTHADTVDDLLKERNIKVNEGDTVQPALDAKVTPLTQIFLVRKGVQIATEEHPIAMPTETVEDASLSFGTTAVRQQGTPGKKIITFELQLENGVEVGRKQIQEVVAVEPVKQVVAKGTYFNIAKDKTSVMAAAGIKQSDYTYVDYIISKESRWNATAKNVRSGAYGLCQALPGTKMASAGADWESNPVTQMKWCSGYATGRYGSWAAAYDFWQRNHYW